MRHRNKNQASDSFPIMHTQFKVTQQLCFITEESEQAEFFQVPKTSRLFVFRRKTDGKSVAPQHECSMW